MKKVVINKLKMYRAVKLVLSDNEESWSGLPAFESAYNAFSEKLVQLVQLGNSQKQETVGSSKRKGTVRREMAKAVGKLARILKAYALDNGLDQLSEQAKLTKSSIVNGSEESATQLTAFVIMSVTEHASGLEDYGYLPVHLSQTEALFSEFQELSTAPRRAIISRKQMTRAIAKLVKEMDALLRNKLDALMNVQADVQEEFYNNYLDARIIVDYAGSKSSGTDNSDSL